MYVDISVLIALSVLLVMVVLLLNRLQRLNDRLTGIGAALEEQSSVGGGNAFDQVEPYLYLRDRLDLKRGIPLTRHWSASPDFLKLIAEHALESRPGVVLECSSGATSLVLARCCQLNGRGHLYSLEDGAPFAERARGHLERYGLSDWASVHHAPLEKRVLGPEEYLWYALDHLPAENVDMLVIDGPSGFIQRESRYPALPLLFDKLAAGCVVFLDDAGREDEKRIVRRWLAEFPGIEHEYIATERGCSRLVINR